MKNAKLSELLHYINKIYENLINKDLDLNFYKDF